jgi:GAF domain-containing protein
VSWSGKSHQLALAAGLVSADKGKTIPHWVLFSAGLGRGSLVLTQTLELVDKIRIALGRSGGAEHIAPLVKQMCGPGGSDGWNSEGCLGRLENRVLPGQVKLLVIGQIDEKEWRALERAYAPDLVTIDLVECRASNPEAWEKMILDLAGDGLLVVPTRTFQDVLDLLSFRFQPMPEQRHLQAFRIRPGPEFGSPAYLEQRKLYLQRQLQALRAFAAGEKEMLERVLRLCRRELNHHLKRQEHRGCYCFSGDIAVVRPQEPGWLAVEARDSRPDPDSRDIPFIYPATVGITRRVVTERTPAVVTDTRSDKDFEGATAPTNPIYRRYQPDTAARYFRFLQRIRSCIKIPIHDGTTVTAVLSLHCDNAVESFDTHLIDLLESLAQEVRQEVRVLRQRQDPRQTPEDYEQGGYSAVAQQTFSGSVVAEPGALDQVLRRLSNELADVALNRAGAFRTAVRLINPERTHLLTRGSAGGNDVYPPDFYHNPHPLNDGPSSAAKHALAEKIDYYIEDTKQQDVHFQPVGKYEIRGHASVRLRDGGHDLGILGVDWLDPLSLDEPLKQDLQRLACRYALAIKGVLVDGRFRELDRQMPDSGQFARLVGELVGARFVALYLRNPATGLYELVPESCVGHSQEWIDEPRAGYSAAPGCPGLIGWIARHRTSLRVANRKDLNELARFQPMPVWRDGEPFEREWGKEVVAWMGIPILAGDEVFGVLRFASDNLKEGFSPYDQKIAEAAAPRLGNRLYQAEEEPRKAALVGFAADLHAVRSLRELGQAVMRILQKIGPCSAGIRVLDRMVRPDGSSCPVMRRLDASEPFWWEQTPLFRFEGQGTTGWVWRHKRIYDSSDPDKPSDSEMAIDEATRAILRQYQARICYPLLNEQGEILGTIHLARKVEGALGPVKAFCSDVVRLTTAALVRLLRQQEEDFELAILRLACQPLVARLRQAIPPLLGLTNASAGVVWLIDRASSTARAFPSEAGSSDRRWQVPLTASSPTLEQGLRLVSDPEHDELQRRARTPSTTKRYASWRPPWRRSWGNPRAAVTTPRFPSRLARRPWRFMSSRRNPESPWAISPWTARGGC